MKATAPIFPASMDSVEGNQTRISILCVVDSKEMCQHIQAQLDFGDEIPEQFEVYYCQGASEKYLNRDSAKPQTSPPFDAVILDLFTRNAEDMSEFHRLRSTDPDIPIIIFSEVNDTDLAVEMIKLGADDFLPREVLCVPQLLARSIFSAIERRKAASERASLKEQLLQAEKLDSLGRIAAGVAHEVKNPLATIQMGLGYLKSIAPTVEDPAFSDACNHLTEATQRAIQIVGGMVDLSRNNEVAMMRQSLNPVVSKSFELLTYEFNHSKTKLQLNLGENLPGLLLDAGKIQQLLINLLRNSMQAMDNREERTIYVATRAIPTEQVYFDSGLRDFVNPEKTPLLTVLEIRDEGPGVDEGQLSLMFEPFYTTKPIGEGSGLGLSIVYQIAELHNCLIRVKNMSNPTGLRTRIFFNPDPKSPAIM